MEAWHNVLKKDTYLCMNLDHYLKRKIVRGHFKVPIKLLHLETKSIPLDFILASCRINYLHNILDKPKGELIIRVFEAQQKNQCKSDWWELVKEDIDMLNIDIDEEAMCVRKTCDICNLHIT